MRYTARIDSRAARGDVGDFWTPVGAEDGKALSISATSFRYDRLTALLTDFGRAPALNVNTTDSQRWRLVARGLAGDRGKTAGYHERTDLTFEAQTVDAWLGRGRSDALRQIANAQMAEVQEVMLALQFGVAVAKSGGQPTEALTEADRQRGYACSRRLEEVVDARFFPAIEARFLGRDDAVAARHRLEFVRGLISTAEDLLTEALDTSPCSAIRRPLARAQAIRAFRGRLRREESVFLAASPTCSPRAFRSRRRQCARPRSSISCASSAISPPSGRSRSQRCGASRRLAPGLPSAGNCWRPMRQAAPPTSTAGPPYCRQSPS